MNVCHEGSPIIAFRDSWPSDNDDATAPPCKDERWVEYCRKREAAERSAAKKASSIRAQRVHQELAQSYARAARGTDRDAL